MKPEQHSPAQPECDIPNHTERSPEILASLLENADIKINGNRRWDIQVFDRAVYKRVFASWSLGLGESYMAGQTSPGTDPWIDKYIFPNGKLPSAREITRAVEGRFIIEDWHNFGQHYDRTLMAWWHRFHEAWPDLQFR